jgi:hypothetical protein
VVRLVTPHFSIADVNCENVGLPVDTCNDGRLSWQKRVTFLPREDVFFVRFLEDNRVKGIWGVLKECMRLDYLTDFVEFLDGEGVERVVGNGGGVVARGVGGGGGVLDDGRLLEKEAVLGGGAIPR